MRTARPPPLQNPSRSAHGRLRIHRGLVQSSSSPFRPRLSFTDQLRMEPANRKPNRKPNTVHRNGVAPELIERSAWWEAIGAGIAVQANGLRALDGLGFASLVARAGTGLSRWGFCDQRGSC